jgi:hypothetical protein
MSINEINSEYFATLLFKERVGDKFRLKTELVLSSDIPDIKLQGNIKTQYGYLHMFMAYNINNSKYQHYVFKQTNNWFKGAYYYDYWAPFINMVKWHFRGNFHKTISVIMKRDNRDRPLYFNEDDELVQRLKDLI